MPQFRFIGQYTNGRDSITFYDDAMRPLASFEGREPSEVEDELLAAKLARHIEFECLDQPEPDGLPALKGLNKAQLLDVAAAEGVEIPEGAKNREIVAEIEATRESAEA